MDRKLTVVPERCSGCHTCELVCSIHHFGANNPKKSAIRVMTAYPHPVIRMPVVCKQCREPKCGENCPENAIVRDNGIVKILEDRCIACMQCVMSCPFGSIYTHRDIDTPFKCDLCGDRNPRCVDACPKQALQFIPGHMMGQAHRMASLLKYAHMKEVEYVEAGEKRVLKYADIEGLKEKKED